MVNLWFNHIAEAARIYRKCFGGDRVELEQKLGNQWEAIEIIQPKFGS